VKPFHQFIDGFFSPFVFSSQLGIDTFILLTGVIISFSFMKQMDEKGRVSIPRLFLHRYLKITPILMFAIFIFMTLVKYFGEGPYYDLLITTNVQPCDDYWWSAFLYVQNYVNPSAVCLLQSWYLSVEMQLLWLSPIFLFPLYFWGRKFSWVVIFFVLLSIALIFTYSFINEFMAFIALNALDKLGDFVRLIFMPTHARMGPWFIGIFCGYILNRMRGRKLVINRVSSSKIFRYLIE
jgi:peptidoglycan/LPS O-acetylase OafA/YrhL